MCVRRKAASEGISSAEGWRRSVWDMGTVSTGFARKRVRDREPGRV